ncbi:PIG-L deacetylase family protein [Gordonia aurantiaca]|uniref:PIG-L deacetylase family protein n=1 Tax=Gordonia sp. B21 TaxID=3151852 RepID=UPI003264B424
MPTNLLPFPTEWQTGLVLVAHPDDPEYGMAAAVARWTGEGRRVVYALASSGERGIEGLTPAETGPLREAEQRASAKIVGVDEVEFWGFPDSDIRNTPELRSKITETVERVAPQVILSLYGGPEWAPGQPNQRDHMEFSAAVLDAYDELARRLPDATPAWLFENGPAPTHVVDVDDQIEIAVRSLAAHDRYLSVLDPDTPVPDQARRQIESATAPRDASGRHVSGFELKRSRDSRTMVDPT